MELINNVAKGHGGQVGVLRRGRAHARRQRSLSRDQGSGHSSTPCALIYGQMNEPPGARLRVGLSGLTVAEYFRDVENAGRARVHRQHLPLHAGRLRSVRAARPHAERRGLPADAGDGDGRPAGAHHVDDATARSRRCRRSTFRPTTSPIRRRRPRSRTSTRRSCSRARSRSSASIRPSIRSRRRRAFSIAQFIGDAALQGGDGRAAHPAALQGAAGHHRDPRHGRAVAKTTRRSSDARAAFSASCRSRSRWPSSSRASRAST